MGRIIIAQWGDLEIALDPYSNNKFQSGLVGIRCFMSCDIGFRYPAAWSVATSVT